jgi:hypothetical protein
MAQKASIAPAPVCWPLSFASETAKGILVPLLILLPAIFFAGFTRSHQFSTRLMFASLSDAACSFTLGLIAAQGVLQPEANQIAIIETKT